MNYINKILTKHDMTQMELSEAVGMTQPRISRLSRIRSNEELFMKLYVAEKEAIDRLDYELDTIGSSKHVRRAGTLNDMFEL